MKRERYTYFVIKDRAGRAYFSKKAALKLANEYKAKVYRISYGYYKDCGFVMDVPTVCVFGEIIN